jgi:Zn-dependent protease/predicted transcriptional regulator
MFGRRFKLFKILGFAVNIDLSWLIVALLVTWSLAHGYFPAQYAGLSTPTYWAMGVAGAAGLFFSIVFHEFFHSLVARRFGLPMKGITLFVFGGVAEMYEEPKSPKAEFFMAIAGPLSSVALGLAVLAAGKAAESLLPPTVYAVIEYLALLNFILAGFNLVPAFPLDGGRVLRSALWYWKKDLRWATRWATQSGSGFGAVLMLFGALNVIRGDVISGLWQFLIGMFLRGAAQTSYQQVMIRTVLEGETVARLMKKDPVTVPAGISLRELVEEYVYAHHYKLYPVMEGQELVGCISTRQVKEVPREEWERRTVGATSLRCSPQNAIAPDTDAVQALSVMNKTGNSRLLVVDKGRLVGIISLKDILALLAVKLDLGEAER